MEIFNLNFIVEFEYTNYRGKTETRRAIPINFQYMQYNYSSIPKKIWVMTAYCLDREDLREFDLQKCKFTGWPVTEEE